MEVPFENQAKLREAVETGDTNPWDMTTILKAIIHQLLPPLMRDTVMIEANVELIGYYMAVEKSISPIPWINTANAIFLSISPKMVSSAKTVAKERLKFAKAGFPVNEKFDAVISSVKEQVASLKARNEYNPSDPISFWWIKEEDDHGVLVTPVDGQYSNIYSIATDLPLNREPLDQQLYIKSVFSLLLKELPLGPQTRRIQYAYFIEGQRIAFFARL